MNLSAETKNARQVTLTGVPTGDLKMQTKIIPIPTRRRNPDRAAMATMAAELRMLRLEIAELREIIRVTTTPTPWGLGERP